MADQETTTTNAPVVEHEQGVGNMTGDELQAMFLGEEQSEEQSEQPEPESEIQAELSEESPESEQATGDEDGSEDSEQSEDEEEDVLSELKPNAAKRARKRIDKLTARAKEAEEKLAEQSRKLEEMQSKLQAPQQEQRFSSFSEKVSSAQTIQELETALETARATKRWVRNNEDAEEVEINGVKLTYDQRKQMLSEAEDVIESVIPKRVSFLQQKQVAEQNAFRDFPAWTDRENPDHERINKLWNDPMAKQLFHNLPNGRYLAGVFMEGLKSLEGRGKSNQAKENTVQKPAQKRQPVAPNAPGMDSDYSPSPSNADTDFNKRFKDKGQISDDDLVAYFADLERAKSRNR